MGISELLSLLGGLALFLYGMHMMSVGLEEAAGDRMKTILEKLTSNRFLGVLVGALITAVIQSSSATTVMVVGFVNSRLMTLRQAIWIIMGANIGTTITGQLVALNVGELAPIMAIIGVVMVTFISVKKVNSIGEILAGLGVLFIGMGMMSDAMYPLRESEMFIQLMTTISNPFIAVLVGAGFTALIQSSSASVGILQTLANSGLIGLHSSIYIIFGQNIGTCITAVLASLSANRNAKRTTIIHLSFNLIGTMIFMIAIRFIPFVDFMISLTDIPAAQIANTHTCFNIITTCILLPAGTLLADIAEKILPILPEETVEEEEDTVIHIPDMRIGSITVALHDLHNQIDLMYKLCNQNVEESMNALIEGRPVSDIVAKNESRIDMIHHAIIQAVPQVSSLKMTMDDSKTLSTLFALNTDIERIGDHAMNLVEHAQELHAGGVVFSEIAVMELQKIQEVLMESLIQFKTLQEFKDSGRYEVLTNNEDMLDNLCEVFRNNQMERLKDHMCGAKAGVVYSEILIDIERIGDHIFNIAESLYHGEIVKAE